MAGAGRSPERHDHAPSGSRRRPGRARRGVPPAGGAHRARPGPRRRAQPVADREVAWASIAEGATHHLVLQDDARVCDDFAAHVLAAIACRPAHGIALYTDWSSPQNSFLCRLAAVAGSPWAALSPMEWIPALAFLLPADVAADLAAYLAPIPDEVTDDDQMIARYCRERGVPMLATVPHLVDNRGLPT
ncbi:hypothetical protein V2I01_12035 [Micromonospora sp. BRA006-A]|nr:hypothetical protein [Micromonospora sp. BRA006-A]